MKDKTPYRLVGLFLLGALPAFASSTTLTGTITDAQGNPLNGVLTMRLPVPAQDQTTNTAVTPALVTFNLVNGQITGGAPLYDVANLQPQGLYYIARAYDTTGALQFYGNYAVTGASFNLGAATPTSVLTSNVSYVLPIFPNQTNNFTASQQFATILSASSPDAATGFLRMANGDQQCWRRTDNGGDDCIGVTSSGGLDFLYVSNLGGVIANGGSYAAAAGQTATLASISAAASGGPTAQIVAGSATGTNLSGGSILLTPGSKNGSGSNGSVQITHGIGGIGNGFQQKRVASCTTGAGGGATCTTTVNWNQSFDDTNYTVVCTVSGGTGAATGTPSVENTSSKTVNSIVVTIMNNTAVASSGTLDCIGVHD